MLLRILSRGPVQPYDRQDHHDGGNPLYGRQDLPVENVVEKDGRDGKEQLTHGRQHGIDPDEPEIIKENGP